MKFDANPPRAERDFSDCMVLLGGIMREQTTCDWLQECVRLCEQRMKNNEL